MHFPKSKSTTGSQWGLSFSYDGFGNRLSQTVTKGSAPASSLAINPATNRISSTGYGYDANGNLTTMPSGTSSLTLSYDVENRLAQASTTSMTNRFGYDLDNRQVYTNTTGSTVESIIFYGAFGERDWGHIFPFSKNERGRGRGWRRHAPFAFLRRSCIIKEE